MQQKIHYEVDGMYTQDQWFYRHGEYVYFYHLLMPQSAGDAGRWGKEVVGASRSKNLIDWEYLGVVFGPSDKGGFDSGFIATGTTLKWNDKFYMFYCAGSATPGNNGGIGVAISEDLVSWQRVSDKPIHKPDARWYSTSPTEDTGYAFADPFVFHHELDNCFYMLITARSNHGENMRRGCIAMARSENLIDWENMPPLYTPNMFERLEVPSLWQHEGKWYLMFSAHACMQDEEVQQWLSPQESGAAFVCTSDSLFGPFRYEGNWCILPKSNVYTARVITDTKGIPGFDGTHALMTWAMEAEEGKGCVRAGATLPLKVKYLSHGGFKVEALK